MSELALLVIFVSPNGSDEWRPIKPSDVPEWVKDIDVMTRLANGDMVSDEAREQPALWYRAEHVPTPGDKMRRAVSGAMSGRRIITVH